MADDPDNTPDPAAPASPAPAPSPATPATPAPDDGDDATPARRRRRPVRKPTGAGDDISFDAFDQLLKQYEQNRDMSGTAGGIIDPFTDHPVSMPTISEDETTDDTSSSGDDDSGSSGGVDNPDDN